MLKDTEDQGGNVIRTCPTFFLAIGGKSRRSICLVPLFFVTVSETDEKRINC